jgi:hypothetical protein
MQQYIGEVVHRFAMSLSKNEEENGLIGFVLIREVISS